MRPHSWTGPGSWVAPHIPKVHAKFPFRKQGQIDGPLGISERRNASPRGFSVSISGRY